MIYPHFVITAAYVGPFTVGPRFEPLDLVVIGWPDTGCYYPASAHHYFDYVPDLPVGCSVDSHSQRLRSVAHCDLRLRTATTTIRCYIWLFTRLRYRLPAVRWLPYGPRSVWLTVYG